MIHNDIVTLLLWYRCQDKVLPLKSTLNIYIDCGGKKSVLGRGATYMDV